jgi:ATP-dependent Clp protease ATP-binding subunit ClpX
MYGPDVSRTGVQRNLLKLMEEAEVDLKTPHDLASQVEAAMEAQRTGKVTRKKINTRNILFIVSGAFNNLEDIINRRLNRHAIGFNKPDITAKDRQDILKQVRTEDLLEYGFESEFVGRLPVTVVLNNLDEEGLYQILKNKYSTVILGKKFDFKAYDIELDFNDEALHLLAKRAHTEKTGARGLLTVFEKVLIKFEKTLPSTDIQRLLVDEKVVNSPETALRKMLLNDSIKRFQKDFLLKNGIFLEFEKDAAELIQDMAAESNKSIKQVCEDLFADYPYGIRLMERESFKITREAVEQPDEYLDAYIRDNYQKQ